MLAEAVTKPPKKNWIREDMIRFSKKRLPYDDKSSIDLIKKVSKERGIDPRLLFASAYQEGMNKMAANSDYQDVESDMSDEYPVDGFLYYGLDTFGQRYDELKKYLPADFKFQPQPSVNEKGKKIISANFRNNEDALIAKTAMIKAEADRVGKYAQDKGIKLDDRAMNYFTMAAYNGGMGNARMMLDEYANAKDRSAFIDQGMTSRQGVHKNLAPRMENLSVADSLLGGIKKEPIPKQAAQKKSSDQSTLGSVLSFLSLPNASKVAPLASVISNMF